MGTRRDAESVTVQGSKRRVGAALRAERVRRAWTQEDLAEHLQLTPRYVAAIERGERNLTLDSIDKLAAGLGVDPRKLLGDHGDPTDQ